jgi:hypothetical protein
MGSTVGEKETSPYSLPISLRSRMGVLGSKSDSKITSQESLGVTDPDASRPHEGDGVSGREE